jgi:hypothetical protein
MRFLDEPMTFLSSAKQSLLIVILGVVLCETLTFGIATQVLVAVGTLDKSVALPIMTNIMAVGAAVPFCSPHRQMQRPCASGPRQWLITQLS